MLITVINSFLIVLGSIIGKFLNSKIPKKIEKAIIQAIGIGVIGIGITAISSEANSLVIILSLVIGSAIGEFINIDGYFSALGEKYSSSENLSTFQKAFTTSTLLFVAGSLSILVPLNIGLSNDYSLGYLKLVLDFITSIILSSSLGIGVAYSAIVVLVYQGALTLLTKCIAGYLSDITIFHIGVIGSILLIPLGFNLLNILQVKLFNFIPAIFLPIVIVPLVSLIIAL